MSCGFCHVGPNPTNPPADPENPKWENLSSNVGAQYFWVDRIFDWNADPSTFVFQLFHTSRPGSLDTSLISTDNINNPRTMNAVYQLLPRLLQAKRWGKETLAGGGLDNRQFNDYVKDGPLTQFFEAPDTVWTPRVLKDGADSVGALGALNRVYINIGTFSEEWLLHFNALVGGKRVYADCDRRRAEELRLLPGHRSTDARHGPLLPQDDRPALSRTTRRAATGYLSKDEQQLTRGKVAFAENCARCHSSKTVPPPVPGLDPTGCAGKDYLAMLEQLLGLDRDGRVQGEDAGDRPGEGFPRRQLPVDRGQGAGHAAADQRLQSARDQRDRRQHLGQLLLAVVQGSAVGRRDHLVSPVHRRAADLHDARRRTRLHAAGLARQPLVDRAVPAEQQRRALRIEPVGRGADEIVPGRHRADALAGEAREGQPARRQDSGQDRSHAASRPICASPTATCPTSCSGCSSDPLLPKVFSGGRHRDRSDPDRHADRPAGERQPAL